MEKYILAVDIGGTKVLTGILNCNGQILTRSKEMTCVNGYPDEVLEQIIRMINNMMIKQNIKNSDILGVGVGVPGPLDNKTKVVEDSPNLHWSGYMFREAFIKQFEGNIYIDKDANVAALGEKVHGKGIGCRHFIYVTISTGIGGGIVSDGVILHGQTGGAAEIGHIIIDPNGRKCCCGRKGCLEAVASGTALTLDAQELIAQGKGEGMLAFSPNGKITPVEIGLAARQGDSDAMNLIKHTANYLASGIADLVNLFNPEKIIIGGGMGVGLQEFLLPPIKEYVFTNVFPLHRRNLSIEVSQLGEDNALLGCAEMVLNNWK